MNTTEFKDTFCNPAKLAQYLTLSNTSKVSIKQISSEICNINNEAIIVNVSQAFMDQLSIGEFLKTVSTYFL